MPPFFQIKYLLMINTLFHFCFNFTSRFNAVSGFCYFLLSLTLIQYKILASLTVLISSKITLDFPFTLLVFCNELLLNCSLLFCSPWGLIPTLNSPLLFAGYYIVFGSLFIFVHIQTSSHVVHVMSSIFPTFNIYHVPAATLCSWHLYVSDVGDTIVYCVGNMPGNTRSTFAGIFICILM